MRARPYVLVTVPLQPSEVFERFRTSLKEPGAACSGSVGRREVNLTIHGHHRRRWSPELRLSVRPVAEGSELKGTMGPHAELWTAFVFCYAVLLVGFTSGSVYGSVQVLLGDAPTGWVVTGLSLVLLAGACGLDLLGRRLGEGQMGLIRGFVDHTLPECEHASDGVWVELNVPDMCEA